MKKIKVVVTGITGRMGKQIAERVLQDNSLILFGATEKKGHSSIGSDVGKLLKTKKVKIKVTDDIIALFAKTDAVIDFTSPEATINHSKYAAQARIVHVIGTTGFNSHQLKKIRYAAQHATIIKSGNMSLGINLIEKLISLSSSSLNDEFSIMINETHHKHKIDAPSGTALMMGEAAAKGKNKNFENIKKVSRLNVRGKNLKDKIVMSSFRKGEVIGDHEIIFSNGDENVIIKHSAKDRGIFANGAIQAVKWGINRKPGLFTMSDVLGIS